LSERRLCTGPLSRAAATITGDFKAETLYKNNAADLRLTLKTAKGDWWFGGSCK
jgi:hypothetical protein